jgi:hypothetical protein
LQNEEVYDARSIPPFAFIHSTSPVMVGVRSFVSVRRIAQAAAVRAGQQVHELYAEIGKLSTHLAWLKKPSEQ